MSDVRRSAGWLADTLTDQERRLSLVESRKPGLAHSSIEDGAIEEFTADGTFASSVGKQPDGSHVAFPATGPTPAAPSTPTLKAFPGGAEIRWNGKFDGGAVSSLDFKHVGVHVGTTPEVDTTPSSQIATIRGELGDVATIAAAEGMLYVRFVAWTAAGKFSDPSPVAAVAIPAPANAELISDALTDLDTKYDGVISDAAQLDDRLGDAETDLTASKGRLDDAEADLASAFGQLNTVDTRVATAKQAAIDAAALDATAKKEAAEAAAAADAKTKADAALVAAKADATSKANAAQAAAITAAAADATAKKEAAEAAAAITAAELAQEKADTAEAAALAAAKTYADAQASGAEQGALDAAKADATAKADAAKAAAIAAAALDATAKKEAAEAVAAADAKTKADAALASAKTDATSKSNAAQAAAITAAAADATAKKEAAEAAAALDASTKANAARDAAIAAAATTAQTKADAAKAQAIAAAATDAQTKADEARARAEALWAQGANLVQDPSFEAGVVYSNSTATSPVSPTAPAKVVTDATKARTGSKYLEMTIDPASDTVAHLATVPVSPDRTYRVGAWVYADVLPATNSSIGMPFNWLSATNGLINNTWPDLYYWAGMGSKLVQGQWKYVTADIKPPLNAVKMATRFYAPRTTQPATTKLRFDDITVVDVTDALKAEQAAAAADAKAVEAQGLAGTAGSNATAALNMATSKTKVYYSTAAATGTGTAMGDLWRQRNAENEVIAEWQWDGAATSPKWVKQTVSGSNVSNMDIGYLTAGAATMSQALIDKLVAGTASFQRADIKNLFATSGTLEQAVIDKLWADVVNAYKITTTMLAVGDFTNLAPSLADSPDDWTLTGGMQIVNSSADASGKRLNATGNTGTAWAYGPFMTVQPGEQLYATARLYRAGGGTNGMYLRYNYYDKNKAPLSAPNAYSGTTQSSASPSGTVFELTATVPDGAAFARFTLPISPAAAGQDSGYYNIMGRRVSNAVTIAEGAVTAGKLESLLVLTSEIIAGNPLGTHTKLNPNGLRVMAVPPGGTTPTEVVRLGTDTDDYFGIVDATGKQVASITSSGNMSAQEVEAANDVTIRGTSVLEMFNDRPRGLVAWASRWTAGKYWAGATSHPYMHLTFPVEAGRAYMVRTNSIGMDGSSTSSDPLVRLHQIQGDNCTTAAPVIAQAISTSSGIATYRSAITINRLLTPSSTENLSVLLAYGAARGTGKISAPGANPNFLWVEDVGPAMLQTGEWRDGTSDGSTVDPTPPASVRNYDRTWNATAIRSFLGNGQHYNYNTGFMYSGLQPDTGNGDLSSAAYFSSDLWNSLAGSTVTGVWAYVYYDWWYQGAGGTAYFGLHGQSTVGTRPAKTYSHATSPNWPRGTGRWVKMSSTTYDGWAAGTHKGFTLGYSGGGYERYGYAHDAKIRVTYTK